MNSAPTTEEAQRPTSRKRQRTDAMDYDDQYLAGFEDSIFPLSPFSPAKVKERSPNRCHNVCCFSGCGCKDHDTGEDRIMSDPVMDTASIHSSDSDDDFPVAGENEIEDSYESLMPSLYGSSYGDSHQMESFLESADEKITWLPLAPSRGRSTEKTTPPRSGSTSTMKSNVSCGSCFATFARPDIRKRHKETAHPSISTKVTCGGPALGWGCGKGYKNKRSKKPIGVG